MVLMGCMVIAVGVIAFKSRFRLGELNRSVWGIESEMATKIEHVIVSVIAALFVAYGVYFILVGLGLSG